MTWKLLAQRFIGPIIAAYLLHWGVWSLVAEAEQVVMSLLTRIFNFLADMSRAAHIEIATWSPRLIAADATTYGLLPIVLGLLVGFWILQRKRKSVQTISPLQNESPR
jgi:uncharacterized membrane protein YqjE